MKMNSSKCHLFISGNKDEQMWAKTGDDKIWESRTVKLLGIIIDNELKFDEHISNVYMKAQRKLTVLARIKKYLDFDKLRCFIAELQIIRLINMKGLLGWCMMIIH